ncbi:glycosyltransferase 87 family protein [Antrihabitans spumae]|uniref:Glycosyltransferase 87 family protein n=1 Tax=Antrihabitans spumae TaxID=3373370 RepID=A0ABW7KHN3_9NOCA
MNPATEDAARDPSSRSGYKPLLLLATVALVMTAVQAVLLRSTSIWMADFGVYDAAGRAVRDGVPLYDLVFESSAFGDMEYTYPPFAALLFTPMSILAQGLSQVLWVFVCVLALSLVCWITLGWCGIADRSRRLRWSAVGTIAGSLLVPVLASTTLGQINMVLLALLLLDAAGVVPQRWRGVATGVAAGIKLWPLLFLVYNLCIGRRADAARGLAAFAATLAVGFVVLPTDSRTYWFDGVFLQANRVADLADVQNQSLPGLLARSSQTFATSHWWLLVSAVAGVAGLIGAAAVHRRGNDLVATIVVGYTALLVSPVTWPHHVVWIVPTLIWLFYASWQSGSRVARVLTIATAVWFYVPLFVVAVPKEWTAEGRSFAISEQVVLAVTGYLVVTVVALVSLPVWLPTLAPSSEDELTR